MVYQPYTAYKTTRTKWYCRSVEHLLVLGALSHQFFVKLLDLEVFQTDVFSFVAVVAVMAVLSLCKWVIRQLSQMVQADLRLQNRQKPYRLWDQHLMLHR